MKRLRFTSCMAFLVNGMLAVMTGTIITYLVRDYGISQAAAGRMVAAQSVGNLIMVLLSGFIIQLIGRKKSLLLFPILFAVGFGGVAFVNNEFALYILMVLTGLGWGLCNNILNIIMMESGGGISTLYTCYAAGSFLGPFFVVAVTGFGLSWKAAVISVAVLSLALLPGFAGVKTSSAARTGEKLSRKDFAFLKNPRYYICNILYFGYIGVEVAVNSWIITYLTQSGLLSEKMAQTMFSVFWLIIIFIRLFVGACMKRFDRANLLICQWIGLAVALTALILCGRSIASVVILVIMAVFMAAISPVNAENADEFIKGKGISGGIMFAVGCVGSTILPMIVGSLADSAGITAGMWVIAGVMYTMIAVCIVNIAMKRRG